MKLIRLRALRGPNLWTRHTAIEAVVQSESAENAPAAVRSLEANLRRLFPALGPLRVPGQRRVAPHLLEAAALALQTEAGCPVSSTRTAATLDAGIHQVVVEYSEEAVGRLAFDLALELLGAAARDEPFDVATAIARLRELDEDDRLGPSTGCIVQAAAARGIPWQRLTGGSLVRLGWGVRQRKIWAAELDSTSAVAEAVAQDKELSKRLLEAAGVPVPAGCPVADASQGWAAARRIGLPVVVKPRGGNQGKGVSVNIASEAQFVAAYGVAAEHGEVLVEKYLAGDDFRLLVVGDRLVAAARRDPPHVIGDGLRSVRELVEQVNADPRRGDGHATALTKIRFDAVAQARLRVQGL
ncbi:MAG TPA: cyanophycin synthetase, partial [Burkholderiaceae bacterium]|nr:cyanophycin synthetase [Burkholderiaceae bacterium]